MRFFTRSLIANIVLVLLLIANLFAWFLIIAGLFTLSLPLIFHGFCLAFFNAACTFVATGVMSRNGIV